MGKPKEYWLQVEEDRKNLLEQLGEKDKQWALKLEALEKNLETEISELGVKVLELDKREKELLNKATEVSKKFDELTVKRDKEIEQLKKEKSQLIDDNAENYKFWDAVKLAISVILKKIGVK